MAQFLTIAQFSVKTNSLVNPFFGCHAIRSSEISVKLASFILDTILCYILETIEQYNILGTNCTSSIIQQQDTILAVCYSSSILLQQYTIVAEYYSSRILQWQYAIVAAYYNSSKLQQKYTIVAVYNSSSILQQQYISGLNYILPFRHIDLLISLILICQLLLVDLDCANTCCKVKTYAQSHRVDVCQVVQ